MDYAANLLNPRSVLVPAIALVIGAGGAIGVYAALDDTDVNIQPTRVVVADPPAAPGEGVAAKHEAATAAAISGTAAPRGSTARTRPAPRPRSAPPRPAQVAARPRRTTRRPPTARTRTAPRPRFRSSLRLGRAQGSPLPRPLAGTEYHL